MCIVIDDITYNIDYLDENITDELILSYKNDFINLLNWSNSIKGVLNTGNVDLVFNGFRLNNVRTYKGISQHIISADFDLIFLSEYKFQARDIKELIHNEGIKHSRGYRYWFIFEMSQKFLQLYAYPYYKYMN